MKIGIPRGLLYNDYSSLVETFFADLGAEVICSPETNRSILDMGVKYCVDEACLPVKVFHGHVCWLRGRCDTIFIPRIMRVREKEFICPKFCGLTEMIANSIPDLPPLMGDPIYWTSDEDIYKWTHTVGAAVTRDKRRIKQAYIKALEKHHSKNNGIRQTEYKTTVALLGHPYNVQDTFLNMNLINKLNLNGIGVITQAVVEDQHIDAEVAHLFKKPFWTFARNSYGAAVHLFKERKIDGIIYISSFACGIDSVVIELIKTVTGDFPFLVLKIDEHTGEAGINTRLEAFADVFGRGGRYGGDRSAFGKRVPCSKSSV